MSDPKKPSKPEKPSKRVWVFGAGIAGLTAAHELAERGFEVLVVEPEEDPRHYGQPALGGMARTQWVIADHGARTTSPQEQPNNRSSAEATGESVATTSRNGRTWQASQTGRLLPIRRFCFQQGTADLVDGYEDELTKYSQGLAQNYPHFRMPPKVELVAYRSKEVEDEDLWKVRATTVVNKLGWRNVDKPDEEMPLPSDSTTPFFAEVKIGGVAIAAEHGFRYFPAFYRHIFDTMGRIRLLDPEPKASAQPLQTVLDNLVSTRAVSVALQPRSSSGSAGEVQDRAHGTAISPPLVPVQFPRDAPRSIRAIRDMLTDVFERFGHTERDVAHLSMKLAKYLTSGKKRRKDYEAKSFYDFLEADLLSEACQRDIDAAPEVLAGMRATESDARTQGSVAIQLLLNQLTGTPYSDATLNGPTTSVWFAPWRDYLRVHNVKFYCGCLTGFEAGEGGVLPQLKVPLDGPEPAIRPGDWFVMAVPLSAMLPESFGGSGLCEKFLAALASTGGDEESRGDFGALEKWIGDVAKAEGWVWNEASPKGPFRHVSGIQYYFTTNQQPTIGHTVYADSPWRLSSISQASFWSQPRKLENGYRGLVSVDIGEWGTEARRGSAAIAWTSSPGEVAQLVWQQIESSLGKELPQPSFYHLDDGMLPLIDEKGKVTGYRNLTPYLVTRPVDWPLRPGEVSYDRLPEGRSSLYRVSAGKWVLCGTYMKTFTRMTTMESANESARHAVNALLDEWEKEQGAERDNIPRCEIFPMEEHELDDVRWLRDIDDRLHDAGLPHLLDVGEVHRWIDALLPHRTAGAPKCERSAP